MVSGLGSDVNGARHTSKIPSLYQDLVPVLQATHSLAHVHREGIRGLDE